MTVETLSSVAVLAGVCIAGINIITEVLKTFLVKNEDHYPKLVLVVSEIMAFMVTYAYCVLAKVSLTPLLFMGALTGGFFLSYGAMFGYDKLYGQLIKKAEEIFKGENK